MKKTLLLLTVLIASISKAQIPNNGFENWNNLGTYMDPQGFVTPNSLTTTFYPITRSIDHYPTSIGNYSIRLENKPSLLPNPGALGLVLQNKSNVVMDGPGIAFPIAGHPTTLTGYYKFLPLNGDTMRIQVILFKNGSEVSSVSMTSTVTASSWNTFTISFPSYTSADSCSILMASYNCDGPPPSYVPHGNSVLYVDNLNFDFLLTSIVEQSTKATSFKLYPNPASNVVSLDSDKTYKTNLTINIYSVIGDLIYSESLQKDQRQINTSQLNNGIYTLEIKSEEGLEQQKFIIQK